MVLSTNMCKTSITIDDVVCVIDTARVNETGYDTKTGTAYLREEWCSKAARRQRSGSAVDETVIWLTLSLHHY